MFPSSSHSRSTKSSFSRLFSPHTYAPDTPQLVYGAHGECGTTEPGLNLRGFVPPASAREAAGSRCGDGGAIKEWRGTKKQGSLHSGENMETAEFPHTFKISCSKYPRLNRRGEPSLTPAASSLLLTQHFPIPPSIQGAKAVLVGKAGTDGDCKK